MVWFRYLSNKQVLGTTTPNENYSYPLLKRQIPKFTPKDLIPDKTWLFVDVTDLNIDKYYDADLQLQTDDASYIVVYEDPYTDDYFIPVKTVINEDILYFETAEEHPAGIEINKQYAIYYKTKGLRKIVEVDNGGRKDYQIFDLPIWIDKELPVISKNIQYNDAVYAYSVPPVTYSISAGRLPSGINIHPTTGQVTGVTSYEGLYFFRIRATSIHGYVEADFSNEIGTGPTTPTGSLPNFYFGQNYNHSFAIQSSSPVRYFISSGSLPDGVVLDEETGSVTGIVNLNTVSYSDVQYSFTIGYENELGITYKSYNGYVYHKPAFTDVDLIQTVSGQPYLDTVLGSGYPNVIYSIEKYNFTANGIYVDENYNLYYDPGLRAGLLEFNLNSNGEYLNTVYPQLMEEVQSIEPDNLGGFYITGYFTAYDSTKIASNKIKKIIYINSLNRISSWSLKKNSLDYYDLLEPKFIKLTSSNVYIFSGRQGFYENSTNKTINYKFGVASRTTGEILDLNLDLAVRSGVITTNPTDAHILSSVIIGNNIYIGGNFNSVNLPLSSALVYDTEKNTSLPNYPISIENNVYVFHEDSFGGYYVGGDFTSVNGIPRNRIAYINSIGKLSNWNPSSNGTVYAISTFGNNIYVGGNFSSISGKDVSNFVVITRSGQISNPNINVNGTVRSIDILGSNVYFSGNFTKISFPVFDTDNVTITSWNSRSRFSLAAINTQGNLLNWRSGLVVDADTHIIKAYNNNIYFGGISNGVTYPVSSVYNVNKNGLVSNIIPEVAGNVYCVVPDSLGGYYIGGDFHYVDNQSRSSIAYINSSGSITSWNPQITGTVYAIKVLEDNIYIGGEFTSTLDLSANNFLGINTSSQILNWNLQTNGAIYSIEIKDDIIYISGAFTLLNNISRGGLAAFSINGNTLPWNPNANGLVNTMRFDGDNIYVGGFFTSISENSRNYIALLNTSGNLLSWNPNSRGPVYAINKYGSNIYIGGNFPYNEPNARSSIYTTNSSGGLIGEIYGVSFSVNAVQYDSVGGLYVGGSFTSINGQTRNRLAHINSSGQLTDWNPNVNGNVHSLLVYGNNIYFGGSFFNVSSEYRNRLAAVNTSGSLLSWNPKTDGTVFRIRAIGNNIYVGGDFKVLGQPGSSFAQLDSSGNFISLKNDIPLSIRSIAVDSSGGYYIGGDFTSINGITRNKLAYINSLGELGSWNPSADGNVYAIELSSSQDVVYVGGRFKNVGGAERLFFAAINTVGIATPLDLKINEKINAGQIYVSSIAAMGDNIFISGFIQGYGNDLSTYGALGINSSGNVFWNPIITSHDYSIPPVIFPYGDNIYLGGTIRYIQVGSQYFYRGNAAAFDSSGNLLDWNPSANGSVRAFAAIGSNIYFGGSFTSVAGENRNRLAAVNTSGNVLPWNPNITGSINNVDFLLTNNTGGLLNSISFSTTLVTSIARSGDNIYFGGYFTTVNGNTRNYLAAVDTSGNVLTANIGLDGPVFSIKAYGNNIYVGGWFRASQQNLKYGITAINTSGNVLSWNPSPIISQYISGIVYDFDISGDNIYFGGSFTSVSGQNRSNLAAANTAGSLLECRPDPTETVRAISISGTTAYVGGDFLSIGIKSSPSVPEYRRYAAAFNVQQISNILSWHPNVNGSVKGIAVTGDTPSDNVYIVGDFTLVNNDKRNYAAAFDSSGNLLDWNPSANANVRTIDIYGSNVTIGGDFYDINSMVRPFIYAVDESADKIDWNPVVNNVVRDIYIDEPVRAPDFLYHAEQHRLDSLTPNYGTNPAFPSTERVETNLLFGDQVGSTQPEVPLHNIMGDCRRFQFVHSFTATLNIGGQALFNMYLINDTSSSAYSDCFVSGYIERTSLTNVFCELIMVIYHATPSPEYVATLEATWNIPYPGNGQKYTLIFGVDPNVNLAGPGATLIADTSPTAQIPWECWLNGQFPNDSTLYGSFNDTLYQPPPTCSAWINNYPVSGDLYCRRTGAQTTLGWALFKDTFLTEDEINYWTNDHDWLIEPNFSNEENLNPEIYIVGDFTSVNNTDQKYIASLDVDGNLTNWGPNVNDTVHTIDISGENIYFGGSFNYMYFKTIGNISGIDIDGNLLEFNQYTNDIVRDMSILGSNIYFGGDFTKLVTNTTSITALDINSKKTLSSLVINDGVRVVKFDNSGGIYIGGSFTSINGIERHRLAHINSSGIITLWNPSADATVYDLDLNGNDVYVAGDFTRISGQPRYSVAAISKTGKLLDWNPPVYGYWYARTDVAGAQYEPDKVVTSIAVFGENIFIGGNFGTVKNIERFRIAKLNTNGDLLSWYPDRYTGNPALGRKVNDIEYDGQKVYIADQQDVRVFDGDNANYLGTFNGSYLSVYFGRLIPKVALSGNSIIAAGTLIIAELSLIAYQGIVSMNTYQDYSEDWIVLTNSQPQSVTTYGDNIYVSGNFSRIGGYYTSAYVYNKNSEDLTNFYLRPAALVSTTLGYESVVRDFAFDENGGIYFAGSFTDVNLGQGNLSAISPENRKFARSLVYMNSSALFTSWTPTITKSNGSTGEIYAVDIIGDNIYFGGSFNIVNGVPRNGFAVLNTAGSLLSTDLGAGFESSAIVYDVKVSGDNIYIAGSFTQYSIISSYRILQFDGNTAINLPSVGQNVSSIAFDSTGGAYIGGNFTSIEGQSRSGLAYINSSGLLTSWNPSVNGNVLCLALSGDNIYFGGSFTSVAGENRNRLAAVNTSGSLLNWNPNVDGNVYTILVNAFSINSEIYIGGQFNSINENVRNSFAVINTAGSLLYTEIATGLGVSSQVYSIKSIGDNIYIAGNFTEYGLISSYRILDSSGSSVVGLPSTGLNVFAIALDASGGTYIGGNFTLIEGKPRNSLAYINSSGFLTSWNPSVNGNVWSILVDGDSATPSVYVAGEFTSINGETRNYLAHINNSGELTEWNPSTSAPVYTMAISGSNIYIGGNFTLVNQNTRHRLAAIEAANVNSIGNVLEWNPSASANVFAMAISGSDIYIGGGFTSVNSNTRRYLASISITSNVLSSTWNPNANSNVFALAISGDNIYAAGQFTSFNPSGTVTTRNKLALINTNGNLQSWSPSVNTQSNVFAIAVSENAIYIGGSFVNVLSISRNYVAAISMDGTLLPWNPNASGNVRAIVVSGDNIYLGGQFTKLRGSGMPVNRLMAINSSGSIISWNPNVSNTIYTMDVFGSNIYIGGQFTSVNGTTRNRLAIIDVNGNLQTWNVSANSTVFAIAVSGSNIYIGGQFTSVGGTSRNRLAAITASGSMLGWNPNANDNVSYIAVFGDNIYIGGSFITLSGTGTTKNRLVAINTSGKVLPWDPNVNNIVNTIAISGDNIYIGGNFTAVNDISRNRLAAINTSGNVIDNWNPNANGAVFTMAISGDDIYIGGQFSSITNNSRSRFAIINIDGTLKPLSINLNSTVHTIAIDGDNIYIGGNFTSIQISVPGGSISYPKAFLAAVNTTGHLLDWNPQSERTIEALGISGDNIYIGSPYQWIQYRQISKLAILNSSGVILDWSYENILSSINTIQVNNGIIYAGTTASQISIPELTRNRIAAANTSNQVLPWNPNVRDGFSENLNAKVYAVEAIGNNVYFGGNFYYTGNSQSTINNTRFFAGFDIYGNSLSARYDFSISLWVDEMQDLKFNNQVYTIASKNEKMYIGGAFTNHNVRNRFNLLGINSSGKILSWNPSASANVYSLVNIGNNIYVGGSFNSINGANTSKLAIINTFGSVLTSASITVGNTIKNLIISQNNIIASGDFFNVVNPYQNRSVIGLNSNSDTTYNVAYISDNESYAFARDSFGGFYIGGNFTSFHRKNPGYIVMNTNSSILTNLYTESTILSFFAGFFSATTGTINAIIPDNLGGFYVAGNFNIINNQLRNRLAYINSSGSLGSWNPSASGNVWAMVMVGDNIYFGGGFTSVSGQNRSNLAAVNTAGSLLEWNPNVSSSFNAIAVRALTVSGDNIYIGGQFFYVKENSRRNLAAVNTSGSLLSWNPNANSDVYALRIFGTNVYIGGSFTAVFDTLEGQFNSPKQYTRNRLAAIDITGNVLDWNPNANDSINALVIIGDNVYVGGNFTSINNSARNRIASINAVGIGNILDWNPNADGNVHTMAVIGTNIYIGGAFNQVNGNVRIRLAAVNTSGNVLDWSLRVNSNVTSIATLGSNIYVGTPSTSIDIVLRNSLAYINSSGGLGSWNPNVNGSVLTVALSGDNIYFGGSFTSVAGENRNRLAAVNTSGSLLSWNPNVNANVTKMLVVGDNVYISGWFTSVNSQSRYKVAAISRSGITLPFNPPILATINSLHHINALGYSQNTIYIGGYFEVSTNTNFEYSFITNTSGEVIHSNYSSKIRAAVADDLGGFYVGGDFTSILDQSRNYLAYINSSGGLGSWSPSASGKINAIVIAGDNVYFGGDFTSVAGNPRSYLAAATTSGSILSWNPSADNNVYTMDISGSNIYVGGKFDYINNKRVGKIAIINVSANVFAFNPDMKQDYDPISYEEVEVYAIKSIGVNVYVGGSFTSLSKHAAMHAIDNSFNSVYIDSIYSEDTNYDTTTILDAAMDSSGGFYIGGNFTSISGQTRNRLAYINSSGQLSSWNPSVNGNVHTLQISGSNVYIGGQFTSINGLNRNNLAAINIINVNSTGNVLTWNPSANARVWALLISQNAIYIGGDFTSISGEVRRYIAATDDSGSLLMWNPSASNSVYALAISGHNIYVGGDFTSINQNTRRYLAAVNTSANVLSWNPNADWRVFTIALSGDNIYIGGSFTSVNENTRRRLASINTTGNVLAWNPSANDTVYGITISGDNIYVGGRFTRISGSPRYAAAIVNTSATLLPWDINFIYNDNEFTPVYKIIKTQQYVFTFGTGNTLRSLVKPRNHLFAANSSGHILDWNPSASHNVYSIAVTGDNIYFGGSFTSVAGQNRNRLAAVNTSGSLLSWNPNSNSEIKSISILGNNIYIAGSFGVIKNIAKSYIAVINTNGEVISYDSPQINDKANFIYAANSKVIVSGDFLTIGDNVHRSLIAVNVFSGEINSTKYIISSKSNAETKMPGVVHSIFTLENNIYIGGNFNYINKVGRNHLAVINSIGNITAFGPNINNTVTSIYVSGTNIYVGGSFTSIENNTSTVRMAVISTSGNVLEFSPKPINPPTQILANGNTVYISGSSGLERDNVNYLTMFNLDGTINYSKSIYGFSLDKIAVNNNTLYAANSFGITAIDNFGTRKVIDIPKAYPLKINDIKLFNNKVYIGGKFETDVLPNGLSLNSNNGIISGIPQYEFLIKEDKNTEALLSDYFVITYYFTDGKDLDTRTTMISPIQSETLGWNQSSTFSNFLFWAEDNLGTGFESILFDRKAFAVQYPEATNVTFTLKTQWFGNVGFEPIIASITGYIGGSMYISPGSYLWQNDTYIEKYDQFSSYSKVSTFESKQGSSLGEDFITYTLDFLNEKVIYENINSYHKFIISAKNDLGYTYTSIII